MLPVQVRENSRGKVGGGLDRRKKRREAVARGAGLRCRCCACAAPAQRLLSHRRPTLLVTARLAPSSKLSLEQRLDDAPAALRGTEELINAALSKAVVAFQRLSQLLKENRGLLDGAVFAIKGAHSAPLEILSDAASRAAPAGKESQLHQRARSFMKVGGDWSSASTLPQLGPAKVFLPAAGLGCFCLVSACLVSCFVLFRYSGCMEFWKTPPKKMLRPPARAPWAWAPTTGPSSWSRLVDVPFLLFPRVRLQRRLSTGPPSHTHADCCAQAGAGGRQA